MDAGGKSVGLTRTVVGDVRPSLGEIGESEGV